MIRILGLLPLLFALQARALTINPVFDASVSNQAISATIQSAFTTAAQFFQNTYSDPITININVYWGAAGPFSANPGGAASYGNYILSYGFNAVRTALTNDVKTASDVTSFTTGTVPTANPTPFSSYMMPSAEAKALSLGFSYANSYWTNYPTGGYAGATNNVDGWVSFNSNTNTWFFNQGGPASNKFDFVGAAEHEISEVMGRISQLNQTNFFPYSLAYDLFRYKGANNRSLSGTDAGVFFSIDNGTNNLHSFNGPGGGDISDWANGGSPDAYDATVTPGQVESISPEDKTTLDVIGYESVPEPGTAALLGTGALLFACLRRRIKRA